MGLYLNDRQRRLLEDAQLVLARIASPGGLDDWRQQANDSLRRLLGADRTCFMFPGAGGALCYSEDTDPDWIAVLQNAFRPNSDCPPDAYVLQANVQ